MILLAFKSSEPLTKKDKKITDGSVESLEGVSYNRSAIGVWLAEEN